MELLAYLRTIHADPNDETSPSLYVVRDDLTSLQEAYVHGSEYGLRPYAVVIGLPANREASLNDRSALFTALVDVHVIQPPTDAGKRAARAAIEQVALQASWAPHHVTALPDRPLAAPLTLETLMSPTPRDSDPTTLEATLRYRARFHHL